jgi:hypothetical protein
MYHVLLMKQRQEVLSGQTKHVAILDAIKAYTATTSAPDFHDLPHVVTLCQLQIYVLHLLWPSRDLARFTRKINYYGMCHCAVPLCSAPLKLLRNA